MKNLKRIIAGFCFIFTIFAFSAIFSLSGGAQGVYKRAKIYNVTMTSADTEYSQALDQGTQKFLIKERSGGSDMKLSYTETESGTTYITIPAGTAKTVDVVNLKDITLYFQSPDAGKVAEIEVWLDK